MALTLVVGGQYGGEGKGNVVAKLSAMRPGSILVKTGGPNCAHTFGELGKLTTLRMVPAGATLGARAIVFPAGCLIHIPTLLQELSETHFQGDVIIDARAGIVTEAHIDAQSNDDTYRNIGSTLTGTGYASSDRCLRRLRLANQESSLAAFICDVPYFLREELLAGANVIVEGSQAFGLSNYHGDYPYCTSRDTTASALLSQVGLGHTFASDVYLTVKCFPTRNAHGNGNLPFEMSADEVLACGETLVEYGGGSFGEVGRQRRVALFDWVQFTRALTANTPTGIAITGLDKLQELVHLAHVRNHYHSVSQFREQLTGLSGIPVVVEGHGPFIEDVRVVSR